MCFNRQRVAVQRAYSGGDNVEPSRRTQTRLRGELGGSVRTQLENLVHRGVRDRSLCRSERRVISDVYSEARSGAAGTSSFPLRSPLPCSRFFTANCCHLPAKDCVRDSYQVTLQERTALFPVESWKGSRPHGPWARSVCGPPFPDGGETFTQEHPDGLSPQENVLGFRRK